MVLFVHCLLSYWSLFSDDWAKNAIISRLFLLSYCSWVYFCVNLLWKGKKTVYKKTDEWYIEWQQVTTNDTTSDNEWQRVVQRMTTSDSERQRITNSSTTSQNEWQRLIKSGCEWYNEWQQLTTNGNEWERVIAVVQ